MKIAEQTHVLFSTHYYSEVYGTWKGEQAKKFQKKAQMLFFSWSHVDIWVTRLCYQYSPTLIERYGRRYANYIQNLIQRQDWKTLTSKESIIGLAMFIVEMDRYKYPKLDLKPFYQNIGINDKDLIEKLARYYHHLPDLSFRKQQDLEMLKRTVQEVSRILKFTIEPSMKKEGEIMVWDLGEF